MQDSSPPEITRKGIKRVLSFMPLFESGYEGTLYTVTPMWERDGVYHMPYVTYSPDALSFLRTLASEGFVVPFDWMSWQEEAVRYVKDSDLLKDADLDTIRKLFTLHVSRDRFFEDHLAEMMDIGQIRAILHRLEAIHSQGYGSSSSPSC